MNYCPSCKGAMAIGHRCLIDRVPAEPDPATWQVFKWNDGRDAPWSVWREGDDDTAVHVHTREQAKALADHLNATGWTPLGPEPPRPSVEELIDVFSDAHADPSGEIPSLTYLFDKNGWAIVDVRALAAAIEWLREWVDPGDRMEAEQRDIDVCHDLLDALGQPADSDVPS